MSAGPDRMVWARRGGAAAVLIVGWLFIAWKNHFHATAPTVVVGLGYLAVIALVYNLWRTGTAAADGDGASWGQPIGAIVQLEREKKVLLKAIKEAEFDREMGKLSPGDADVMIQIYRAQAIEVIKELDRQTARTDDAGNPLDVREQIEREVKARLEVEARAKDKAEKQAEQAKTREHKQEEQREEKREAKREAKAKRGGKRRPAAAAAAQADPAPAQADPAQADPAPAQAAPPPAVPDAASGPVVDAAARADATKPDAAKEKAS